MPVPKKVKFRVLCLDIEGGYGGSSRSLYESISYLSKNDVEVEIWCRRNGPIQSLYEEIGVSHRLVSNMPHVSSLSKFSRNLYVYGKFFLVWLQNANFRRKIEKVVKEDFDLVHLNHEGLFILASWLRRRLGTQVSMSMHIRTLLKSNVFSRWQYRTILRSTVQRIYITEMEQNNIERLTGSAGDGVVIHNIVSAPDRNDTDPAIEALPGFKVLSVSNYAWLRGNDRLIEIAEALHRKNRGDIRFIVAGNVLFKRNPTKRTWRYRSTWRIAARICGISRRRLYVSVSWFRSKSWSNIWYLRYSSATIPKYGPVGTGSNRSSLIRITRHLYRSIRYIC